MKRTMKRFARGLWRLSGPVRRPLARRIDERQAQLVGNAFEGRMTPHLHAFTAALGRVEHSINVTRCTADAFSADANLLLDSLVREMGRLQMQVEILQQMVCDANERPDVLSLADDHAGSRSYDQMKAG